MNIRIDLRSDTVTKPSLGMREVMSQADVGDDVYGDDPTVNALQEKVAALFGHEAALFTPSGSLANQLAIRTLVKPGEELLSETNSHIVRAELGAGATFSGITTRTWPAERGLLSAEDPLAIATPDAGPYLVSTKAIAVENTHNFGGGTVQPLNEIIALRQATVQLGISMHLDGARIWNAHIASGVPFLDYGKFFDTINVCLSKGLGAPVGSLVISSRERIAEMRIWRKRYGAGMRQIGMLAAAADYALENNLPLLAADHRRAKRIAERIHQVAPEIIDPAYVETNIVALNLTSLPWSAAQLHHELLEMGIATSALGPHFLRIVTHLDIDDAMAEETAESLVALLQRAFMAQ